MLAVASFLVGGSGGYWMAQSASSPPDLASELVRCEAGNAGMTLRALEALRASKPDEATSSLETSLSLHAVVLDEFLRELQPANRTTGEKFLRAIAAYRAEHPFQHGDAEADRNVEGILASYPSR